MDAQQFLAEFGHIANAPSGVSRLRELILALAVQGKLVEQDHNDEPAATQVEKLRSISEQRVTHDKRKRVQPSASVSCLPIVYASVPDGWESVKLCELVRVLNGRAYSRPELLETGTPVLRVGNLFTSDHWYYSDLELDADKHCDNGDLLYAWSASFGPFIWNGSRAIYHYHIWKLDLFSDALLNKRFLYLFLLEKTQEIKAAGHGISMAHMTKEKFEQLVVLLPPFDEQSRIVAKVEELMAVCDKLETQRQQRRSLQNALRQIAVQTISSAIAPYELKTAWMRFTGIFGYLFQAVEDVDELVAEVKSMAVRGLLSLPSQTSPDLDQIASVCSLLRTQYIESGLMRRQRIVATVETAVDFPEHWAVAPFDQVAIVIGGVTKGRDLRGRDVVTCPYLAVANVQRGFFNLTDLKQIQIVPEELNKYLVKDGDLLITEGGDWDKVGRTAIWRGGVEKCLHQNHIFKARIPSELLMKEWVELVFNSSVGRDYFAGASKQTTNLASINMSQLRGFPLPIPPLEEQQAILRKVDALTKRCSVWREQLRKKQELASLLATVYVEAFTGTNREQQMSKPMKAPHTELISLLRLGQPPSVKAQAPLATILARHNGELAAKDLWQRFGGEIDTFYAQLKTEVANGWIKEPQVAEMREKCSGETGA